MPGRLSSGDSSLPSDRRCPSTPSGGGLSCQVAHPRSPRASLMAPAATSWERSPNTCCRPCVSSPGSARTSATAMTSEAATVMRTARSASPSPAAAKSWRTCRRAAARLSAVSAVTRGPSAPAGSASPAPGGTSSTPGHRRKQESSRGGRQNTLWWAQALTQTGKRGKTLPSAHTRQSRSTPVSP